MLTALFILLGFLVVGLVGGTIVFVRARSIFREQKNYERGLKMVPLLIHLPPPSDDIDNNGRDVREITDENISKAQVLYNIIASTVTKGFKSKVYGQRHIAFEIVANKGFVHFYTAVPVALVPVVQQAVVSAYPSARLEEVAEHNIFSPVGRISGTIGGELILKENFAYSIATYQDLKRDAMQSLLNALSTLEKEDGAGVQILFRPADPSWRKRAGAVASKKRKGKDSSKGFDVAKQLFSAPFKPPENKPGDNKSEDKQLSSLEQSIVDSIDDKTRYPGFEVLIRVVASSNIAQRAQATLSNIVATFALFDAPGKNGFKYVPARDIENFVTGYIMRFFPQENRQNILNVVELATIFHFPDQRNIPTSQLERQASKQVDGPRNIMDDGLLLGYNLFRGTKKAIRLTLNDRRRHIYVVGQTGTGKSTFLENLALQDMLDGRGFAFVDPHGDTAEKLLSMVPKERTEDVIYFCPADMDYPLGLNLFEFHSPEQKDFLIQEAINMLYKLYDPQHQGIIGPRYEHWFRNAALTLMSDPGGATFIDIPKLFTDNAYAKEKLQYVTDQTVLDFWNKEMAQTADFHKSEVLGWFVSKFGAFLSNEMMRNIIGQTKSSFNLREIMDQKKILLVNLSKGRTGDLNSRLLGMIFVMKFQAAAMSRASIPEEDRVDFCLYVDEFQNFSTDSFADILSEARKYRLNLIVANQFTTQLTDQIRDAVFGNVGTIVAHRVGTADAEALVKVFQPVFDVEDLQRIPNYNAVMRMLINGVPTQPFSLADLPPLGSPNKQLGDALKQLSAAKYGRPKAIVESEIFKRLETKEQPKPAAAAGKPFGRPAGKPIGGAPIKPPANAFQPVKTGSSFLDDWLQKRSAPTGGNPFVRKAALTPSPVAQAAPVPAPVAAQAAPVSVAVGSSAPTAPPAVPMASIAPVPPTIQPPQPPNQIDASANDATDTSTAHSSGFLMPQPAATPAEVEDVVFDPNAPATAPATKSDFVDAYMRKRAAKTIQPLDHPASGITPEELYQMAATQPDVPVSGLAAAPALAQEAAPMPPEVPVVEEVMPAPEQSSAPELQPGQPVAPIIADVTPPPIADVEPPVITEVLPPVEGDDAVPPLETVVPAPEKSEPDVEEPEAQAKAEPAPPAGPAPFQDVQAPNEKRNRRRKKSKKAPVSTVAPESSDQAVPTEAIAPTIDPAAALAATQLPPAASAEQPADVAAATAAQLAVPQPDGEMEVQLRADGPPPSSDTIFIDQDGNLFLNDETEEPAKDKPADKKS